MAVLILALKPAHASVVTVPQGLNPGDWYQLVFVTSDTTQAKNTEIDYYNNWVNGLANASESLVKDLDTEWRAIASTESIDAMENTHTNPIWDISCPIYNLAGELVASSYSDLWDGDINASINIDEIGTPISIEVWTGTSSDVLTFFRCCGYLSTAGTRRPGPLASVNQPPEVTWICLRMPS